MWLGYHFQGQKVKGQLAGDGGILWRRPARLVTVSRSVSNVVYKQSSETSCVGAATICPRPSPLSVGAEAPRAAEPTARGRNVAAGSHGAAAWCVNAVNARWVKRPGHLDLWPLGLESGIRVTCDAAYLYANFGLPMLGLSVIDLGPMYATDRQTDVEQHHRY